MPTLAGSAYRAVFFGFLSIFLRWAILSGILSLALIATTGVYLITSNQTLTSIFDLDPSILTQTKLYMYLEYYQYLWVVFLVVLGVGSIIYAINLGQASSGERPIDYYQNVAWKALLVLFIVLMIYVTSGSYYFLTHGEIVTSQSFWQNMTTAAQEGYAAYGVENPSSTVDWIYDNVFPYFPMPFFVGLILYVLKNAHTGWIGNVWEEPIEG